MYAAHSFVSFTHTQAHTFTHVHQRNTHTGKKLKPDDLNGFFLS